MKKQYFLIVLIAGLVILPFVSEVRADVSSTPQEVLQEITQAQGVSSVSQVDCAKVADSQLEELGDAWMEQIHPGETHDYMDQMMGGEGSESLRQAHIQMGRNYLGCGTYGNYGYGMMGGGLPAQTGWGMMGGYDNYGPMMGWNGYQPAAPSPSDFFSGLAWAAVVAAIVLGGIKLFGKK